MASRQRCSMQVSMLTDVTALPGAAPPNHASVLLLHSALLSQLDDRPLSSSQMIMFSSTFWVTAHNT